MSILFIFLFLAADKMTIDLDAVGMFDPDPEIFQLADGNFLLTSRIEMVMLVVDPTGKKVAEYSRMGRGPNELYHQTVISITKGRILVVSNLNRILSFNERLVPAAKEFARFSDELGGRFFSSGVSISENEVYLINSGMSMADHLVQRAVIEKGLLQPGEKYIPQVDLTKAGPTHGLPPVARNFSLRFQGDYFVKFRHCIFAEEDHYEVTFYNKDLQKGAKVIRVLQGPADNIEKISTHERIYPISAVKLGQGYVVSMVAGPAKSHYHDYYNADGGYVKREPGEYRFLPSYNSSHVFKYDLENDLLILQ
ncbi:MAG: hypothetical protein QNK37_03025 [Acidobacteriota bacterium]|nr:hypothetical protein [Acidobacteriota bacterium]